jgi:selenocysteine-specific elongation factor
MHRVVIGTAGHVDHGKTSLIRALTGVDCHHLPDERARGITIDLGFAHLRAGDVQIGFVDVPGHQRYLHNALAGLGTIPVMLLAVAADEGVRLQTEEHLGVCSILRVPRGIVALTKCDLVDAERLAATREQVRGLLGGTPFRDAPILSVSSETGEGVDALKAALVDAALRVEASPDADQPARLPIDRVFHIKGAGVVVTGTLLSGRVRVGETLEVLPSRHGVRVRGVQVHGESRKEAVAIERTSLQLAGVTLDDVRRGYELVEPGSLLTTDRICADISVLAGLRVPLSETMAIRLHIHSTEVLGHLRLLSTKELAPGATGVAELRTREPVAAARGDRLVLCDESSRRVLGGGVVLDAVWTRPKRGTLANAVQAISGDVSEAIALWVGHAGELGLTDHEIATRLHASPADVTAPLAELVNAGLLVEMHSAEQGGSRWIARKTFDAVADRARACCHDEVLRRSAAPGVGKMTLASTILPRRPVELRRVYLELLERRGIIQIDGEFVTTPEQAAAQANRSAALSTSVVDWFREAGLAPGSVDDLCRDLSLDAKAVDRALQALLHRGDLVRLANGAILHATAIADLCEKLQRGALAPFRVSEFKSRFGLTRRWAVPLLEHLDSIGATQRNGDERTVQVSFKLSGTASD